MPKRLTLKYIKLLYLIARKNIKRKYKFPVQKMSEESIRIVNQQLLELGINEI